MKAGGDNRDLQIVSEFLVGHGTENDSGVFMNHLADNRCRVVHLMKGKVVAPRDVQQYAAGAVDRGLLQERTGDGQARRHGSTLVATRDPRPHDGQDPRRS